MWVATAASSANSMSLVRTLRLSFETGELKSLHLTGFLSVVSNACFRNRPKKIPKERWSKDATLFDAAADFKWLRGAVIELHCSLQVSGGKTRSCSAVWVSNRSLE